MCVYTKWDSLIWTCNLALLTQKKAYLLGYIVTILVINQQRTVPGFITTLHSMLVCNTFTPQTKGIPEDTFAMYTSLQGDI